MIDDITREDIERLAEQRGEHLISIYLPMETAGDATQQNPIRLKNALQEASRELEGRGLDSQAVASLLEPAFNLVPDHPFWQYQSDGLAIFLAPGEVESYRLPIPFEETLVLNDRFHVKPLLRLLTGDGRFYVLALSQDEVRLLRGSRYSVQEMRLSSDLPDSLTSMLRFLDISGWRPSRMRVAGRISGPGDAGASTARGGSESTHSVSYVIEEDKKQRILEFFQLVDNAVREIIEGESAPLVIAGVEYLHPIYEKANNYRHLLDDHIRGNPEELSNEELHASAWEIVAPRFSQERQKAADDYHVLKARSRATDDLQAIVSAAAFERVDTLWAAGGEQVWGVFDRETGEVRVDEAPAPDNYDLLDYAAVHALANSGTVYVVEPEDVPDGGPAAAMLRY